MSDGMGRELAYLSSHATNRYFIPNWGIYEIQAVDSRGNWIRRKEVTQHGNGEISTAIATRKITYYDDIIIEEIPSDAPNFGLG